VDADCAPGEVCVGLERARDCAVLCASDEDCVVEGEACIQVPDADPSGATVCAPIDPMLPSCELDSDCGSAEICVDGFCVLPAECETDTDCPGGSCESGVCVTPGGASCENTAACVAAGETAYCADLGDGESACLDVSCGAELNSCGRCELGPNGGARDANGPVIFYPQQKGTCSQDPNQCLPGNTPFVCTFTFLAFDPDGNLPTSDLNGRINLINRNGTRLTVFGASTSAAGNNRAYEFRGCFPESQSGFVSSAVVLGDAAGNDSQTLCVDGRL